MKGSGSVQIITDPDPRDPKTGILPVGIRRQNTDEKYR